MRCAAIAVLVACGDPARPSVVDEPSLFSHASMPAFRRGPYQDEHGNHTPRAKTDAKNGRIRGCVTRAGKPVANVVVKATVLPTGMSFTTDKASTDASGCYEIVITANHHHRNQIARLSAQEDFVGGRLVTVDRGQVTTGANFEVGAGFTVSGVVRDAAGAPVAGVTVDADAWVTSRPTGADGRFEVKIWSAGRHRLRVDPAYERVVDARTPFVFDVPRLDGALRDVVLVVDDRPKPKVIGPLSNSYPKATLTLVPVSVRAGVSLPDHAWCSAWTREPDGSVRRSVANSSFTLPRMTSTVRITCDEMAGIAAAGLDVDDELQASPATLPIVAIARNGVDLGVELRAHPDGALVVGATVEAAAAGLRAGDVIVAIDGVAVRGWHPESVFELGFRPPPGSAVTWTYRREGREASVRVVAPGLAAPGLYDTTRW